MIRLGVLSSAFVFIWTGSFAANAQQVETKEHTYDSLGRLVTTDVTGGQNNGDTRKLCYDSNGNRTEFKIRNDGTTANCAVPSAPEDPPAGDPPAADPPPPPPSNNPPNAEDDAQSGECYAIQFIDVTSNDSDPEGNYPLTVTSVNKVSGAATVDNFSGGIVTFTFGPHLDGSTFTYVVEDSLGASDTAQIMLFSSSCQEGQNPF